MATVYLVSCVSKKQNCTAKARDLYISDWFKKAKTYTEARADSWFILPAKHGLIAPFEIIEPYEQTLKSMAKVDRLKWADEVLNSIVANTTIGDNIVFLAGSRYREFLINRLQDIGYTVEVPLARMGIGEQLSWLGKNKGKECGLYL